MVSDHWGADCPISMPEPLRWGQTPWVDMGHFCMTEEGIAHNITTSDLEFYQQPVFEPLPIPDVHQSNIGTFRGDSEGLGP